MRLTRKHIRKMIIEAIDSRIIAPNTSMRSMHHAHQQGSFPPEYGDEELRGKLAPLRKDPSHSSQADELYRSLPDESGAERSIKPIFGASDTYQEDKEDHEMFLGSGDDYSPFGVDNVTSDSAFLEIAYPLSELEMDEPIFINVDCRLWKIISNQYERESKSSFTRGRSDDYGDYLRFYKEIKDYVENPKYAEERQRLANEGIFSDWRKSFNSFEDFLMEKAERLKENVEEKIDDAFNREI